MEAINEIQNIINDEVKFSSMTDELIKRVDVDGSQDICKHELKVLLTEFSNLLDIPLPKESDIEDIFKGHDIDESGKFNKEEFQTLLKRLIEQIVHIISSKLD